MQVIHTPAKLDAITPRGLLGARMRLNLERLMSNRGAHTKLVNWGADQIGRWIGATVCEAEVLSRDDLKPIVREKVDELIAAQDDSGFYYGRETPPSDDWNQRRRVGFGHGRGVWNLVEYYEATGDEAALASALRGADWLVADRDNWVIARPLCGGVESTVSPMARLGALTRTKAYTDYARYMAENIDQDVAPPSAEPNSHVAPNELTLPRSPFTHHTHSYLNTMHGVVDLALASGEEKYLEQARRIYEASLPSVWINGAFPESYGDYYERCDETCSTVDWAVLCLKLFTVTGDVRFLDQVELTALNQMPFGQNHVGGFTTYRSLNRQAWMSENNHGGEQTECCSMSGGWGLAQIARHVITATDAGVSVNLPLDQGARVPWRGGEVDVDHSVGTGAWEMTQTVVADARGDDAVISVRKAWWCGAPRVRIDGIERTVGAVDGFYRFDCPQGRRTVIEISLPMTLRVVPPRRNLLNRDRADGAPGPSAEPGVQYGPWVLMLNREMHPGLPEGDVALRIPTDRHGRPEVGQSLPEGWAERGAVPLFVRAYDESDSEVSLTPCANMTHTPLTVKDPYLLRFREVRGIENVTVGFSKPAKQGANG